MSSDSLLSEPSSSSDVQNAANTDRMIIIPAEMPGPEVFAGGHALANIQVVEDVNIDDNVGGDTDYTIPTVELGPSGALREVVEGGEPTTLHVKIVEACNIPKMDAMFGKADPYCRVSIKGRDKTEKYQKTQIIRQSYMPVWKKTLQFNDVTEKDVLHIEMLDWDLGSSNDPIANLDIPLNQYNYRSYPCDGWYNMTKANEKLPKEARIRIMLYLAPTDRAADMDGTDIAYISCLKLVNGDDCTEELVDSPFLNYRPSPFIYPDEEPKKEHKKRSNGMSGFKQSIARLSIMRK